MDIINSLGIASVAAITVICYLVGAGVKVTPLDSKYIPVIVGVVGVVGYYFMPDFPATDIITAVAVGIVSGLAATGVDQVVKQLGGGGNE